MVIVLSNLVNLTKDYRQRLLNVKVMLSLRRAMFERLLHLPLPKLWDMKTGGILSRLTGDVDTTTGLMQMAIVSPAISVIRLVIAIGVLMALNWRLAFMAMAVIPGAMFISFASAKRIRPIYRIVRKDVEAIDGRVGETFSGIRVVRAFGRELARDPRLHARRVTRCCARSCSRSDARCCIWTSWGLLVSGVNVIIVWYGGALNLQGRASIGDIMTFQWYTFLLMNPVWQIVNSFSELQRSLAAMERVFEVLSMGAGQAGSPRRARRADASSRRSGSTTWSSSTARAGRSFATSTSRCVADRSSRSSDAVARARRP